MLPALIAVALFAAAPASGWTMLRVVAVWRWRRRVVSE
jgi:hypothetical protein